MGTYLPLKGDHVLYDNGGRDIGVAGRVEKVIAPRIVMVAGVKREIRHITEDVWCIIGPIGPNSNQARHTVKERYGG